MTYTEFSSLFLEACDQNKLSRPTDAQITDFWRFTEHLMRVNQTTNLTAIRSIPDVIYKHYIDSLSVSHLIPQNARVLDLGCGPGFPSIPIAITRPDLTVVALDSTDKKIRFLNESAALLSKNNLKGVSGRAEDTKIRHELGQFDIVVSRAVSRLNILVELCLPYTQLGGKLLAMKGAKAIEELEEAKKAVATLGGTPKDHEKPLVSNDSIEERHIIEITKIKETPAQYPRQYATIIKKPL